MSETTKEHLLVQVLLRSVQTSLWVRSSGADAAVRDEADAALELAFRPIWERVSELELSVGPDRLELGGAVVLTAQEDEQRLIDSLASAGIRRLTLTPGVELEEIKLVLTAVAAARSGDDAPDLLTSLFRADLHHLQHLVEHPEPAAPARRPGEASPSPTPPSSPDVLRDAVRRDAASGRDAGIVRIEKFDSTLYFLDEREIAYLKSAIDREYAQDLALSALSLLLDILELRAEPAVRGEVIGILSDFLPELLGAGEFEAVAELVSGVREASRDAVDLTPAQKEALDRLRGSISHRSAVAQLFHGLEAGEVAPTPRSMGVLLRELRPAAIRQVLAWSSRLSNVRARTAVSEALDTFFTEWPLSLSRMLNAPDREVVLAGLELAGRLKHEDFVDIVAGVAGHDDPRVRRRVAETLASIASAASLRRLVQLVSDEDRDVRIVVYRTFARRPFRGAFSALQRALAGKDLEERGRREKRALFEAFAAVGGPQAVSVLTHLLKGKNPSGPRPSSHTRACAATALGIVGTPGARAELERAAKDRDPVVRSAVGAALRAEH